MPGQWWRKGLTMRLARFTIFGGFGVLMSLLIVLVLQATTDQAGWPSVVAAKLFFLLMVGSIAGYAFRMAVGDTPNAARPAPFTLAALCPACGHLAPSAPSTPGATCERCGLVHGPDLRWESVHTDSVFDDVLMAGVFSSVGFLGLFMVLQTFEMREHGMRPAAYLLLGLLLGVSGLVATVNVMNRLDVRRRLRGQFQAKLVGSPESSLSRGQATAQLDRHGQLLSAEGSSTWRQEPTIAGQASEEPARLDVLRALARLESRGLLHVADTRALTWVRRPEGPRVESFVYRVRTSDEPWTCEEQIRPRIVVRHETPEKRRPGRWDGLGPGRLAVIDRVERLSEVLGIETGQQASFDEVIRRLSVDPSRSAALLALADEADEVGSRMPVAGPDDDRPWGRGAIARRTDRLAAWLLA